MIPRWSEHDGRLRSASSGDLNGPRSLRDGGCFQVSLGVIGKYLCHQNEKAQAGLVLPAGQLFSYWLSTLGGSLFALPTPTPASAPPSPSFLGWVPDSRLAPHYPVLRIPLRLWQSLLAQCSLLHSICPTPYPDRPAYLSLPRP